MAYSNNQSDSNQYDDLYIQDDVARQLLDEKISKQQFSDIDLKFTKNPNTGDISKRRGANSVKQAIKNLILTEYYEKLFKPGIGSNIRKLLFEPIDFITATRLETSIRTVIENYEPRAIFLNVEVIPDAVNLGYTINVTFGIKNNAQKEVFTQFLNTVRG